MTTKTTTKSYQEHFEQRGTAYERAMQAYPHARDEEFMQVINASRIAQQTQQQQQPKQQFNIADVPAGGGYLKRYLPDNCTWFGHEPCASFTHHATTTHQSQTAADIPLLPSPGTSAPSTLPSASPAYITSKTKRRCLTNFTAS